MDQAIKKPSRSRTKEYCLQDLKRFLLFANIFVNECEQLQKGTMSNLCSRFDNRSLRRLARSLDGPLSNAVAKVQWFAGVAKKIIGLPVDGLHHELDPDGDIIANVSLLTEWVAEGVDRTAEVNILISGAWRKEQFRNSWKAAIGDQEWTPQHEHDFNAWYLANIIPPLT